MPSSLRSLKAYGYAVPPTAIAQIPARPRDAAKLLVFDQSTEKVSTGTFRELGRYLPPRAVLVLNDTKVIPARLRVHKPSGGRVELLCLSFAGPILSALADRRLEPGWVLQISSGKTMRVLDRVGSTYHLKPSMSPTAFRRVLEHHGTTPLPPYLRHSPLSEPERRRWYQSVFAKAAGSVAAPTASLHFTSRLLADLRRRRVAVEYVTLQVGLGTFAPLTAEQLKRGRLHVEQYEISDAVAKRLNAYRQHGRPIVAVGTTVARTLESATRRGRLQAGAGETDLFIRPGYTWKFVDALITNFHVPESSLMMLVASLVGRERLLRLYRLALKKKFRFFSFGDGMLITQKKRISTPNS